MAKPVAFRLLLAVLTLTVLSSAGIFADTDVSIYYTASLNGNLIGCECKGVPKAGLSTTAAYIRGLDPESSVIIDLGDFNDARTDKLLSAKLVELYSGLGYDAAALGDQELGSGVDFFKSISGELAFIADNVKIDGKPVNQKPLIIERKGIKIGIAAVIDPGVFFFYPEDVKSRVSVFSPVDSAVQAYKALVDGGAHYKLLVYHGNLDASKEIFADQTGWDAILSAHDQILYENIDGQRVIASPGEEGNRVGRLDLSFRLKKLKSVSNSMRYFTYEKDPEDPIILQAFEDYKKELINNLKNGKN